MKIASSVSDCSRLHIKYNDWDNTKVQKHVPSFQRTPVSSRFWLRCRQTFYLRRKSSVCTDCLLVSARPLPPATSRSSCDTRLSDSSNPVILLLLCSFDNIQKAMYCIIRERILAIRSRNTCSGDVQCWRRRSDVGGARTLVEKSQPGSTVFFCPLPMPTRTAENMNMTATPQCYDTSPQSMTRSPTSTATANLGRSN